MNDRIQSANRFKVRLSAFSILMGLSMLVPSGVAGERTVLLPDISSSRHSGTTPCKPYLPGEALWIEEAIDLALCNHPRIQQSWAAVMERGADLGVARSAYFPTLNVSSDLSARHNRTEVDDLPVYSSNMESLNGGLSASVRLVVYDFGKRQAAKKRAQYLIRAAEVNLDVTVLQVCLNTATAYFEAVEAQARVTAARNAEARATTSLMIARERRDGGAGTIADVITAEAALARSQLQRGKSELDLKLALGSLAVAMGLSPEQAPVIATEPEALTRGVPFGSVQEVLEISELDNPLIRSAREAYTAAQMAVQAARTESRPTVALALNSARGSNKYRDRDNKFSPQDIPSDSVRRDLSVQLSVSVPLFTGFRSSHQIRAAAAREEQARWAVDDARLKAGEAISRAFESAGSEVKNVELSDRIIDLTNRALEAALERYRSGAGNLSEVILAQNASDDAERDRIGAAARLRTAKLSLALSLGRMESWALE